MSPARISSLGSVGRCRGARKGPAPAPAPAPAAAATSTGSRPRRGPVLVAEDARDCDCVSIALSIFSPLVQISHFSPANSLMINQFLATTDAVRLSLPHSPHLPPLGFHPHPINYDRHVFSARPPVAHSNTHTDNRLHKPAHNCRRSQRFPEPVCLGRCGLSPYTDSLPARVR
jgi:hypothetical protein